MRRRGSVLVGVLAVIGMLVILLASLRYYEGLNRQGVERAEAVLHSQVALRWWEAGWLGRTSKAPPPSRVSVSGTENAELKKAADALEQPWASSIFQPELLPDLSALPDQGLQASQRLATVQLRDGLPARPLADLRLTASTRFPYAACAPRGHVSIHILKSWANPRWQDRETKGSQGGGVAARLYAGQIASVVRAEYCEVMTGGERPPEVKEGQVLSRTRVPVPLTAEGKSLEEVLGGQIKEAIQRLHQRNLQDGDKTAEIFNSVDLGRLLSHAAGVGNWADFKPGFLSLATASQFPFYTWCTIRIGVNVKPPRISALNVRIHGFLPPDSPLLEDVVIPPSEVPHPSAAEAERANEAMLAAVRVSLQSQSQRDQLAEGMGRELSGAGSNHFRPAVPEFRDDEEHLKISWDGQPGVVYLGWLKTLPKLISSLELVLRIPPQILDACKALAEDVPVYWFGSKRFKSKFLIEPKTEKTPQKLTARATMTVPRGRSFYVNGDLTLEGDLWIQRGASFEVDGSLVTVDPHESQGADWPFQSHGRIILEQGATLVVRDQLKVAGSPRWGSVLVTSQEDKVEGITSAILVGGRATFAHGILGGMTIEDLCQAAGGKDPLVARLQREFLEPYFDTYAPNLSKCRGPFWVRKPHFAEMSTAAGFDPLPNVTPPIRFFLAANLNCLFFSAATLSEVPFLNAVLGEFLALHSDAWAFGDESVPALVKLPLEPLRTMVSSWGGRYKDLRFNAGLENRLIDLLGEAQLSVNEVPESMMKDVYRTLFMQAAWVLMPIDPPVDPDVYKIMENARSKAQLLRSRLGYRDLSDTCLDLQDYLLAHSGVPLAESPGVLVYAGGDLSIGTAPLDNSSAVGMFVAGGTITSYCQRLIGSALSFRGSIRCKELWYYPGFTRASLALPGPMPEGQKRPLEQIKSIKYGKNLNPKPDALLIGIGRPQVSSEMVIR